MKIKIHDLTYIFLFISFLSGYFEYMFILLLLISVHESGHYFIGKIVGIKKPYIIIYPFGGITILNEDLNIPIYKEFLTLIGGIFFQLLFYLIVYYLYTNSYLTTHVYNIIFKVNKLLISFNFLPILPLDGGKIINIILDNIFSYRLSNKISVIISIIFIIIFGILNRTLFAVVLIFFLIKSIYLEIINLNYKYNRFLFERYSKNYKFNKIKEISSKYKFKRGYYHIIGFVPEDIYLDKMFSYSKYY